MISKIKFGSVVSLCLLGGILGVSAPASAEWVDWQHAASLRVEHNDNLNQAVFSEDELSDSFARADVEIGRLYQLGGRFSNSRIKFGLGVGGEIYNHYDEMNKVSITPSLVYFHKFGLGHTVPKLRLEWQSEREKVDDEQRERWLHRLDASVNKPFNHRFDVSIGLAYLKSDGRDWDAVVEQVDSDVLDFEQLHLYSNARFALLPRLMLGAQARYLDGEFHGQCSGDTIGMIIDGIGGPENFTAFGLDGVFNEADFGEGVPGCRYVLDGDGYQLGLDLNYALTKQLSVAVGYSYQSIDIEEWTYENNIGRLSLQYLR